MNVLAAGLVLMALTAPEDCLVRSGERAVASVEHSGRTYQFRKVECREEFLADPERYSQLYDALAELAAAGTPVQAPAEASLVPS